VRQKEFRRFPTRNLLHRDLRTWSCDLVDLSRTYDVLIVGGGNAALCAAITARQADKSVLVLEHAPQVFRGGNSRHTRNLRVMHPAPVSILTESYLEDEYWDDLLRVTGGNTDEYLARMTIRATADVLPWMAGCGVRFQPSLSGTLSLSRTNAFFLGGGKALMNAYYVTAEKLGVDVLYDTEVQELRLEGGTFRSAAISCKGFPAEVQAKTVIAAAGGFQANIEWLKEYWGDAANNFIIRGTPYAKGRVLKNLLDQGVMPVGDPKQCHAVAIDARAPKFDGGIVTRLDCIPYGIVVGSDGQRFYDEGEDFWPKRYAIWGLLVAHRPDQIAYSIIDAKSLDLFMPSVFPPVTAQSIAELATKLGLRVAAVEKTVRDYNAAVQPGSFNGKVLDDCRTEGLTPPKTHWARRIDTAPFYAYPLRPGITFTYLGVKVDDQARVIMADGRPTTNVFAAGEMMAGSILGRGYLAGFGMTIGTVFGRIAGREAAKIAKN
jgi:tricarballylate dehydrogenase